MEQKTMREAGISGSPLSRAVKLAQLSKECGVDGVVASVREAKAIRKACGPDFLVVTPGVRPREASADQKDDQVRTATPTQAIHAGADYIVVGRPIIADRDPRAAAIAIVDEIAEAKQLA